MCEGHMTVKAITVRFFSNPLTDRSLHASYKKNLACVYTFIIVHYQTV
jgi:hypothetical protein